MWGRPTPPRSRGVSSRLGTRQASQKEAKSREFLILQSKLRLGVPRSPRSSPWPRVSLKGPSGEANTQRPRKAHARGPGLFLWAPQGRGSGCFHARGPLLGPTADSVRPSPSDHEMTEQLHFTRFSEDAGARENHAEVWAKKKRELSWEMLKI